MTPCIWQLRCWKKSFQFILLWLSTVSVMMLYNKNTLNLSFGKQSFIIYAFIQVIFFSILTVNITKILLPIIIHSVDIEIHHIDHIAIMQKWQTQYYQNNIHLLWNQSRLKKIHNTCSNYNNIIYYTASIGHPNSLWFSQM